MNTARTGTPAERRGDFSADSPKTWPKDPLTGQVFTGGIIPANRLDPVAQAMFQEWVQPPNTPDGRIEAFRALQSGQTEGMGKIDHRFSPSQRVSGTLFYLTNSNAQPFDGGSNIPDADVFTIHYHQLNVVTNHTWTISPNKLNELGFTYTRDYYDEIPDNRISWPDFGSQVPLGATFQKRFPPALSVTGYWATGVQNENMGQVDRTESLNEVFSWTRGSHSIKAGTWYAVSDFKIGAEIPAMGLGELCPGRLENLAPRHTESRVAL